MIPVVALVLGLILAALTLVLGGQLAAESIHPVAREAVEQHVHRPAAVIIPGIAAVLLLVGTPFAGRTDTGPWWLWLLAGLLFVVDVLLVVRMRRRVQAGRGRPGR